MRGGKQYGKAENREREKEGEVERRRGAGPAFLNCSSFDCSGHH